MNLIFLIHPNFLEHQSMPRFATMLANGMLERGHKVELWSPKARFCKMAISKSTKKWLGYVDQFAVFPKEVKSRLWGCPPDTLFIFTDHTLGPWVPLVADRPNVIHSHDFLAQRSAMGEIKENVTRWTGRRYQKFIRGGYSKGRNFIAVSQKTKEDLHRFHLSPPVNADVVYNGMNQSFTHGNPEEIRTFLGKQTGIDLNGGYLLHVGGNSWYKNRLGVLELYNAWRSTTNKTLPLLLIGQKPSPELSEAYIASDYQSDIYFLLDIGDELLRKAYAGASVFLFPSLAEGFGWPIAEAMASGCPVITTNEAPMTEVAGSAGFLISRRPLNGSKEWALEGANMIQHIIELTPEQRQAVVVAGFENARRFNTTHALDQIESIYERVLQTSRKL